MKTTLIILVVLIILGVGAYFIIIPNNSNVAPVDTSNVNTSSGQNGGDQSGGSQTVTTVTTQVSSTTIKLVPAPVTVGIKSFAFSPSSLTVKVGTKVTWTNNDTVAHTVTSDSGNLLNSPILSPGSSFSFTFNSVGTSSYHCSVHPMMKGKIVVEQ